MKMKDQEGGGNIIVFAGSEVMDSVLSHCLHGLSDAEVRKVGVALGISSDRWERVKG